MYIKLGNILLETRTKEGVALTQLTDHVPSLSRTLANVNLLTGSNCTKSGNMASWSSMSTRNPSSVTSSRRSSSTSTTTPTSLIGPVLVGIRTSSSVVSKSFTTCVCVGGGGYRIQCWVVDNSPHGSEDHWLEKSWINCLCVKFMKTFQTSVSYFKVTATSQLRLYCSIPT